MNCVGTEEKFNNNIKELTYYLVSLFYKSGRIYKCSREKISKLLVIYKFCAIKYNPKIFDYYFYIQDDYIGVNIIDFIYEQCYFSVNGTNGDNKEYFDGIFDDNVFMPKSYVENNDQINCDSKKLLEIIFRNFASYSSEDLACLLNEMLSYIVYEIKFNGSAIVGKNEFLCFLNDEIISNMYKENKILNFIKEVNDVDLDSYSFEDFVHYQKLKRLSLKK